MRRSASETLGSSPEPSSSEAQPLPAHSCSPCCLSPRCSMRGGPRRSRHRPPRCSAPGFARGLRDKRTGEPAAVAERPQGAGGAGLRCPVTRTVRAGARRVSPPARPQPPPLPALRGQRGWRSTGGAGGRCWYPVLPQCPLHTLRRERRSRRMEDAGSSGT